ncbi:uncharacterized protein LOC111043480 isoform X1 [Nilaparvata lugens]|uniref:uncharacterized protein LOC111043480 isoform X1 n=1 Tax=Nilaparvata lugens TaxID=108931 RepID=UPI00193CF610|nr:uncharacterized protein LOC111043480 isoform X1 [Nilaparvata lugens]XP_039296604.1 uncharacterized protein LOC111043480 isoform X1 [Nilaparvata lugens]
MEIDLETRGIDHGNLALSLSTAIHLVLPVSFLASNHVSLLVSGLLSLAISQIQSICKCKASSIGLWQSQLVWCGMLGLVCRGLVTSLCHRWIEGHLNVTPVMSALTCVGVTTICALGLERSGILRFLLTISVVASLLLIVASSDLTLFFKENHQNNVTEPAISTSMVSHTTVLLLAAFLPSPSTPGEPFLLTEQKSLTSNVVASVIYAIITYAFHLLYVKRNATTIPLNPGSFLIELQECDWRRLLAAIFQTLCLGLALPDVVLGAAASTLRLCGRVVPRWFARETLFTGTHVAAFVFSGLISTVLTWFFPIGFLVELVCLAHIGSDGLDALQTLYARFQPTYYHHKERGKSARYEMLATSEGSAIMKEAKEGGESEDSGNSSDTDIDAAVAEFRVRTEVVEDLSKPVPLEPTPESGRKSVVCLTTAVALFLLSGILLRHSWTVLSLLPIVVGVVVLLVQSMLPTVSIASEESGNFMVCLCLMIDCLLISQVSLEIIIVGILWHIIGQLLSFKYNSRRFHTVTQRLKSLTSAKPRAPINQSDSLHILQ